MEHPERVQLDQEIQVYSIETRIEESVGADVPNKAQKLLSLEGVGYTAPVLPRKPVPRDPYYSVWLVFFFQATAFWLVWNLINFLGPYYYFDYWFSNKLHIPIKNYGINFLTYMGVIACTPLFAMGFLALIPIVCIPMLYRHVFSALVYLLSVMTLLIATCTWTKESKTSTSEISSFMIFTLIVICFMMGAVGCFQSYLYGMAAEFPRNYTSAIVIGTNVGGLFSSLLYIFCTHDAKGNILAKNEIQTAKIYYGISFAYVIVAIGTVYTFWRSNFFRHFNSDYALPRPTWDFRKFLREFGEVFLCAWSELLAIFMIFFTMYCIFPTISVGIQPWPTPGQAKLPKYFLPIGTFLNFYTMSTIGAIAGSFIKFPANSRCARNWLLFPCYASMYLIVYFMFCNFHPNQPKVRRAPVIFKNEWFYFIANGFLGYFTGILSAVLMPLTTRVVRPELRRLAGQMALASLLTGLYFGSGMTNGFVSALSVEKKLND